MSLLENSKPTTRLDFKQQDVVIHEGGLFMTSACWLGDVVLKPKLLLDAPVI